MTSSVSSIGSSTPIISAQAPTAQSAVDAAGAKITGISSQITALNEAMATINEAIAILEQEKAALKAPSESSYWHTEQKKENGETISVRVFDSAAYNADMTTYLSALHSCETQIQNLELQLKSLEQQLAQKDTELQQAQQELTKAQEALMRALAGDEMAQREAQQRYEELQKQIQQAQEQLLQAQANAQRAQEELEKANQQVQEIYASATKLAGKNPEQVDELREQIAAWKPGDPPVFVLAEPVDSATLTQESKNIAAAEVALQTSIQNTTGMLPRMENGVLVPPATELSAQEYYELMPRLASFESGLHSSDAGLLVTGDGSTQPQINSQNGTQLINAWLEAGFSIDVAAKALESMVGQVQAAEIMTNVAIATCSPNGPLSDRNMNQFVPADILATGDAEAIRKYITDTNAAAYQDDIDAKAKEIADAKNAGKPADEITKLEGELTTLETRRDTQNTQAIAQFDAYYQAALTSVQTDVNTRILPKDVQERLALGDAGKKYNDWVFYHSSEGQKPTGPSTLFATGAGDGWPIELNDIDQGSIGDCYFMASIGALAQDQPELIERMIKDNGDGTYTVTFHKEVPDDSFFGRLFNRTKVEEVEITVDLTMPSDGACADPSGDTDAAGAAEVWPQVLEKAWATYQGSYGALEGGFPGDALFALTGKKTEYLHPNDYSADKIERDLDQNKAVVMDTGGVAEDEPLLATYNLVAGHAYTVKDIRTDADGKKYIILYNPWGVGNEPKPIPYEDAKKVLPQLWVN